MKVVTIPGINLSGFLQKGRFRLMTPKAFSISNMLIFFTNFIYIFMHMNSFCVGSEAVTQLEPGMQVHQGTGSSGSTAKVECNWMLPSLHAWKLCRRSNKRQTENVRHRKRNFPPTLSQHCPLLS